jgi:hypothetical protein
MTKTFRFVYCADVRLDAPFRCAPDGVRARLIEAGRTAFRRTVDLCLEQEVHALLVSGSLMDEPRLSVAAEDFLVEQVARLDAAGVDVVLTGARSACAASMAWNQERIHWLDPEDGNEVSLRRGADMVGRVVGTSDDGDAKHATTGSGGVSGLVRRTSGPQPAVHMPPPALLGPLIGRSFDEPGVRGAVLVEVPAKGEIRTSFHALAPMRWETLELRDLDDVNDASSLAREAARALREHFEPAGTNPEPSWMLRVLLNGTSRSAERLSDDELLEAAGEELARGVDAAHVEFIDLGIVRPIDVSEHRGQPHLIGLALAVAEEVGTNDDLLDQITPAELAGCGAGDLDTKRTYLRALLNDVEASIAEALVKESGS